MQPEKIHRSISFWVHDPIRLMSSPADVAPTPIQTMCGWRSCCTALASRYRGIVRLVS